MLLATHAPTPPRFFRSRRGFTLAEVIVSVAIVSVLAAAVVPTVQGRMTRARGEALARELLSLQSALNAFRQNVGNFPKNLDYLTAMPSSGAVKYCSGTFSTGDKANWRGPYISRSITGNYSPDGYSTITDVLTYSAGPPPTAEIIISPIDASVAAVIEDVIDGPVANYSAGAFHYGDVNALQGEYFVAGPSCP